MIVNYDQANPPVEIRMECIRSGHRQTIDLRLPNADAAAALLKAIDDCAGFYTVTLADGSMFKLDLDTVWYVFDLPASHTYSAITLRLGGI